jgi:hypothetical protein
MNPLHVSLHGLAVGLLSQDEDGPQIFVYDPKWMASASAVPLLARRSRMRVRDADPPAARRRARARGRRNRVSDADRRGFALFSRRAFAG